jgi:hypothetical protein
MALVLALAGAAPVGRTAGPAATPAASAAAALAGAQVGPEGGEPNASTTVVGPSGGPAAPPPAVRIAATGASLGVRGVRVDIADVLLRAYSAAVTRAPAACHLPVSLLAAIGQVESGSLLGRPVDRRHRTAVLGPVLDGHGYAAIADTDGGQWDGNATWDRAVGPMQFIPSTWRMFGVDGDGDGVANPQDVEDAAASAAAYLCYGGRDLSDPVALRAAILAYNHSPAYLGLVLTYQQRFAGLGLDDGTTVAGLSTHLALSAVQVAPDGWAAGRSSAHASPTKARSRAKTKPKAKHRRTAPVAASVVRAARAPARSTSIPTPTGTPTPTTTSSTPTSPDPTPTTDGSGSPSPTPQTPSPSGNPAPPSSTPPSPASCPTAPTSPTGTDGPTASTDPSPTGDPTAPTDPADPDATCAPCPVGTEPSPEAPCLPPAEPAPSSSTDPSPSGSATATSEASPSSVP